MVKLFLKKMEDLKEAKLSDNKFYNIMVGKLYIYLISFSKKKINIYRLIKSLAYNKKNNWILKKLLKRILFSKYCLKHSRQ
jgi:hypothetical protein